MFNKNYKCEDAIRRSAIGLGVIILIISLPMVCAGLQLGLNMIIEQSFYTEDIILAVTLFVSGLLFASTGGIFVNLIYAQGESLAVQKEMLEEQTALRLAITNGFNQIKESPSRSATKGTKSATSAPAAPEKSWTCTCGAENRPGTSICSVCFSRKPE